MKKKKVIIPVVLCIVLGLTLLGKRFLDGGIGPLDPALKNEKLGSIKYFLEQSNTKEGSPGYGLVRDRYPGNPNIASIAATGYGLSALPLAVEEGLLTKGEAEKRASLVLDTFLNMENVEGFYYHFVDINTGERVWNSELSNIDTAILVCGALHVGEYFGDEVKEKAQTLYERINWQWFVNPKNNLFYMSYTPEKGFAGHWDYYAEQLMLYVLGAGSPTYPISKEVYDSFTRHVDSYGEGQPFIHSWFGSIFTYQFSHGWIDFRDKTDEEGINWFDNSIAASLADYNYCKDLGHKYKTFEKGGWGLTACDGPKGYEGLYGSAPSGSSSTAHRTDGTVPPAGSLGSIVFTPDEVMEAVSYFETVEGLKGEYGYKDAVNEDANWIAKDYIGIDKGITMVMLSNYENEAVWKDFMKNQFVQQGLENLKISKK